MSRPRRAKRTITVEGTAYRWVVCPDDGYMVLRVSLPDRNGQRLRADFRYGDVWGPSGPGRWHSIGQRRVIAPGLVRAVILAALAKGWEPTATRPGEFRIRDDEAEALVPLEGRGPGVDPDAPA